MGTTRELTWPASLLQRGPQLLSRVLNDGIAVDEGDVSTLLLQLFVDIHS